MAVLLETLFTLDPNCTLLDLESVLVCTAELSILLL
jgi:hypothetical protein